jgi:hypothetical protein
MVARSRQRLDLEYDQTLYMVIGGEKNESRMLTEKGNLVVFESLWHAGPLVHELEALGIPARMISMHLEGLYCLAEGMDLGLWVLRHDGIVTSVDEIVFPD